MLQEEVFEEVVRQAFQETEGGRTEVFIPNKNSDFFNFYSVIFYEKTKIFIAKTNVL